MNFDLFRMLPTNYSFKNHLYLIHPYKEDLTLNNLQSLICHKTHQTINYLVLSYSFFYFLSFFLCFYFSFFFFIFYLFISFFFVYFIFEKIIFIFCLLVSVHLGVLVHPYINCPLFPIFQKAEKETLLFTSCLFPFPAFFPIYAIFVTRSFLIFSLIFFSIFNSFTFSLFYFPPFYQYLLVTSKTLPFFFLVGILSSELFTLR